MDDNRSVAKIARRQFLAGQAIVLLGLATGWNWQYVSTNASASDGGASRPQMAQTINSADLRYLYPASEPGREYVRSMPVADLALATEQAGSRDPNLREWLQQREALIRTAIQEPEIVFRQLPYRRRLQHWLEMYAIKDPLSQDRYLAVTLGLANLPGEKASTHHKIMRIFPARTSYFWTRDASGGLVVKSRWMRRDTSK